MAAICVDPNCKNYFRGEVVPVAVEIVSATESEFFVCGNVARTYCEVRTSSGEIVEKLYPRIQEVTESKKQLFCSWDTGGLEVGYYNLRFWVSINLSGARDGNNELIEDYRLASDELRRYIKSE